MLTLLDSNILLRFPHRASPDYALVRRAVRVLYSAGETLCYTSQNLGEFWNVCTRLVLRAATATWRGMRSSW